MEANPEVAHALNDPQTLREMARIMSNPVRGRHPEGVGGVDGGRGGEVGWVGVQHRPAR